MKEKLSLNQNLLIGSLLFGLFFGAGNLIFPVKLGQSAGSNTLIATIGFLITGVGLPMLGIIASALSRSENLIEMAAPIGKKYSIFLTCLLYLTIGPLFSIPRTATVAFEVGISPFIGEEKLKIVLFIFSFIFFAITLYFSLKPGRIIDWIGKYLTPIFLVLLGVLLVTAFISPMGSAKDFAPQGVYETKPLISGVLDGYNTMDALASLAFGVIIISNIKKLGIKTPKYIAKETIKSGLVSIVGMALIYSALAYVGATSLGSVAEGSNGGIILSLVSNHYFGIVGQVLLAGIVTSACIKTAIGLITACAEIFTEMFPRFLSYKNYAIVFTIFSFVVANFGLNKIIELSIPVLMFIYPLAITLIILVLLGKFIDKNKQVYRWTTTLTFIAAIFDLLNSLPQGLKDNYLVEKALSFASSYLPLFSYGFGWLVPSLIGFLIGLIVWKFSKSNEVLS